MTRTPTNFGPYQDEYQQGMPLWRRVLILFVKTVLTVAGVVAAGTFVFPVEAHAGRSCEPVKARAEAIVKGMELAGLTSRRLDATGAQVVILARAGQDLSKYGLHYSHLGIAYKTAEGPWRVVHKLNQCGTAVAGIYRQGLGEFFLDDPWRFEAAFVVPSEAVQGQLMAALREPPARIARLHTAPYSLVSYAWGGKYQQSNQWALETLAAAMEPATVASREQAQAWLKFKGYEPGTLKLGPMARIGGRISAANIAFDDHPNEKRFADRIETVTADSVFTWLPRAGLGATAVAIQL
ncbi:conserved hypothetical protein [Burkholderiales bacterium 8X]|nr:conserved hypothetical protein [Burkholderiales bacterium 8X]